MHAPGNMYNYYFRLFSIYIIFRHTTLTSKSQIAPALPQPTSEASRLTTRPWAWTRQPPTRTAIVSRKTTRCTQSSSGLRMPAKRQVRPSQRHHGFMTPYLYLSIGITFINIRREYDRKNVTNEY